MIIWEQWVWTLNVWQTIITPSILKIFLYNLVLIFFVDMKLKYTNYMYMLTMWKIIWMTLATIVVDENVAWVSALNQSETGMLLYYSSLYTWCRNCHHLIVILYTALEKMLKLAAIFTQYGLFIINGFRYKFIPIGVNHFLKYN